MSGGGASDWPSKSYRPDIDGLRTLAVAPVVLFHAGVPGFSGGFVGVDIFFVISGYLITSIIYRDLSDGAFRIRDFYERRIRRIFPALFVMLAASGLAGLALALPAHLKAFGQSLLAATLSLSNVYFWLKTSYFAADAATKPLLHTWTLGVEEQFYALFPLGLILLRRLSRGWTAAVVGIVGAISFALCVVVTSHSATAAFYLLPFRAWELLLGSLAALSAPYLPNSAKGASAAAAAGLALIVASLATYGPTTPFPGVAAMAPSLGAALLIFAGMAHRPAISRLLAFRPFVWIGRISYSLYLWHWPIFVFARYYLVKLPTPSEKALMVAATVAIAALSYQFVEKPFRRPSGAKGSRRAFRLAAAATTCGSAFGLILYLGGGLPGRLDARAVRLAGGSNRIASLKGCLLGVARPLAASAFCETSPGAEPTFILWGDSHASAYAPAFLAAARDLGAPGILAFYIGCPPLLGVRRLDTPRAECRQFNARVLAYIGSHPNIVNVVLASRWAYYAEGAPYPPESEPSPQLRDELSGFHGFEPNTVVFERGLDATLLALKGRRVSIIGDAPEVGYNVPDVLAKQVVFQRSIDVAPSAAAYHARQKRTNSIISRASARHGASFYDVGSAYCNQWRCPIAQGGSSLYLDDDHLSPLGAQQISAIAHYAVRLP